MTRIKTQRPNRSAFTLVELLVVMAIIAILIGLLLAAVMRVMMKINEVQTRTDIAQMDVGINSFMQDYGLTNPPPSYLLICEDSTGTNPNKSLYPTYQQLMNDPDPYTAAAATQTVKFFQQWFGKNFNINGKYNWNGNVDAKGNPIYDPPYLLQGQQCLVFYLGGIPVWGNNAVIGMSGFAPNITNPAAPAVAGSTRKGPYFNFLPARLSLPAASLAEPASMLNTKNSTKPLVSRNNPVYLDPWKAKPQWQPYVFFSSQGGMNNYNATIFGTPPKGPLTNDCSMFDLAGPYYELTATKTANYAFNNRFQIISAGLDGQFGGGQWSSTAGATGFGRDDQANFASSILAAGE